MVAQAHLVDSSGIVENKMVDQEADHWMEVVLGVAAMAMEHVFRMVAQAPLLVSAEFVNQIVDRGVGY